MHMSKNSAASANPRLVQLICSAPKSRCSSAGDSLRWDFFSARIADRLYPVSTDPILATECPYLTKLCILTALGVPNRHLPR